MSDIAAAYSDTGAAWARGPARLYDRLADVVVDQSPTPLRGRVVLDLGAGAGAASRAIARVGGRPLALDPALGMLLVDRPQRPPAIAGDALALPLRTGAIGAVVAAFSLNHLPDPAQALREILRVTAAGAPILASAYSVDDTHPVKEAVVAALHERGWREPGWYGRVRTSSMPALATVERCLSVADAAGLDAKVRAMRVPFPDVDAAALVAWRLGMAQHAPFVSSLAPDERDALVADATARLGPDWPPLVRSIVVIAAVNG